MIRWEINEVPFADAGITGMTVSLRTQSASQISFTVAKNFDQAQSFSHGQDIKIERYVDAVGTTFFRGKIDRVSRSASTATEEHQYHAVDAWQDLEDTIYQESWKVGSGTFMFPKSVLGLSSAGAPITVAQQITNAITFAVATGTYLTVGTIAGSDILWPQEVKNISVAEVIRQSLKFYPNHIVWIDYSTTPPQLNVTPSTSAPVRGIDLSGNGIAESLSVSRRDDLMPAAVRIIYSTATIIDSDTFRDGVIDQYPLLGPTGGPRVIIAEIELAGMSMQFQKSPVEVVALPTSTATAVAYLKEKFPVIAGVPDAAISVTGWTRTFVAETAAETARHVLTRVNANAPRLPGTSVADLPNELRKGSVADWMRVKVGKVHIAMTVAPSGSATAGDRAAIEKLPSGFTVNATNATTKIYKGCSQFQAGETAVPGLAESYYNSCHAAYQWEGSVSLVEAEAGAIRYHGTKVNITGSADSALTTMNAMVHAVDIDIDTGRTDISFGPAPHLAPADILELQRQLRGRPVTWWTTEERDSNKLGSATGASSKGDTLTPYDSPETILDSAAGGGEVFAHPFRLSTSVVATVAKYQIAKGAVILGTNGDPITLPAGLLETDATATAGYVVIEADVSEAMALSGWAKLIVTDTALTKPARITTTGTIRQDKLRILVGKLTTAGSPAVATAWQAVFTSVSLVLVSVDGVVCLVPTASSTAATVI